MRCGDRGRVALCFWLITFCPLGCPPLQGLIKVERINGFPVSSEAAEAGSIHVCVPLRNSSLDDCVAEQPILEGLWLPLYVPWLENGERQGWRG